nr:uncharacterized protein LOC109163356 [Ipomoea batatas]
MASSSSSPKINTNPFLVFTTPTARNTSSLSLIQGSIASQQDAVASLKKNMLVHLRKIVRLEALHAKILAAREEPVSDRITLALRQPYFFGDDRTIGEQSRYLSDSSWIFKMRKKHPINSL